MPAGRPRVGTGILLLVVSTGTSLGLLEAGVRIVAPRTTKLTVPAVIDDELIYRLPPAARGSDVKEEFAVTIATNAQGLRDRDYPARKPSGVRQRILVLGDSMTFGEGVEAEQTYPKLLERALAERHGGGRYEVINAAVRGYGNDQELVLFERLVPVYHPDVVLLAFFAVNDFDDNLYGGLFTVAGDRLERRPLSDATSPKYRYYRRQSFIQTFPGYRTLVARSHLINLLRDRWARVEFRRSFGEVARLDRAREEQAWILTHAILRAWAERARRAAIRPVLLLVPSWEQVHAGRDDVVDARTERVTALARAQRLPVVMPRAALTAAVAGPERVYYPKDRHMTPAGHRVVAGVLERCLASLEAVSPVVAVAPAEACFVPRP